MIPGLKSVANVGSDIVFTSDNTLAAIPGMNFFVPQAKHANVKLWLPLFSGATGGFQFQLDTVGNPAGFVQQIKLFNINANTIIQASQTNTLVYGNAMASAGFHYLEVIAAIVGGIGGSTITVKISQNTSDPNSLTVLGAGSLELIQF